MRLESIKYSEYFGEPKEWVLDELQLDNINLIVGKNASGKTRSLNIINNLARLIRGEIKPNLLSSSNFEASFQDDGEKYSYVLNIQNGIVTEERLKKDDDTLLIRGEKGEGKIYAKQIDRRLDFQAPQTELVINVRRDKIQHPFFEPLYTWASSVFHYAFGSFLGRNLLGLFKEGEAEVNPLNTEMVVGIYKKGEKEFNSKFKKAIISDLKKINYEISDIGFIQPSKYKISQEAGQLAELFVQEEDLKSKTEQTDMSQGMFRVLSLIIQVNYSILALSPSCILIDDIGEGLDFERSCALIDLLLKKIGNSKTQLVMATNDRFIMNNVPLEMWTVLKRKNSQCNVFNFKNSKEKFEEFRFTGLNNFDFFASNFVDTL
jgi:energy-coupling factor transporter ATP-binding protein EcfA2